MKSTFVVAALMLSVPSVARAQSTATTASDTRTPLVIGETFTIASKTLGEVRRINVYAPASYAESPGMRLPVLYMPDGGIAEDFLHVAGLVQVSSVTARCGHFCS